MADATVALTGVSATTGIGRIGTSVVPGQLFDFVTPAPQVAFAGYTGVSASLDVAPGVLTIAFAGTTSVGGALAVAPQIPTVAFAGTVGAIGALALTLEKPTFLLYSTTNLALSTPAPQISMIGNTGAIGNVLLTLPTAPFVMSGDSQRMGSMALVPTAPSMVLAGTTGSAARMNATLKALALALDGYTGVIGTLTIQVPAADMALGGVHEAQGSLSVSVPALYMQLTGSSTRVSAPTTLAMHTETLALTSYSNFPFNSFATFNGVYLGASAEGVFALVGDTDANVPIQAVARVGMTDFGTSFLKRVDRVYIGHRAAGPMVLRIITEEVNQRDYLLASSNNAGLHGAHVRIGKGVTARYWQFELRNQNGADFSADIIELKPTKLGRRVGGSSA